MVTSSRGIKDKNIEKSYQVYLTIGTNIVGYKIAPASPSWKSAILRFGFHDFDALGFGDLMDASVDLIRCVSIKKTTPKWWFIISSAEHLDRTGDTLRIIPGSNNSHIPGSLNKLKNMNKDQAVVNIYKFISHYGELKRCINNVEPGLIID